MAKKRQVDQRWNEVRAALAVRRPAELLEAVRDLYGLSQENRDFLSARFMTSASRLEPYKETIDGAIYPAMNEPIRISAARRAISQYTKATGDQAGTLELMVYFVERGNAFTVDVGDIDEGFYSSLESMFARVLDILKSGDSDLAARYLPRLRGVRDAANNIGWGYYDYLCDALGESFPNADEDEATADE